MDDNFLLEVAAVKRNLEFEETRLGMLGYAI